MCSIQTQLLCRRPNLRVRRYRNGRRPALRVVVHERTLMSLVAMHWFAHSRPISKRVIAMSHLLAGAVFPARPGNAAVLDLRMALKKVMQRHRQLGGVIAPPRFN